MTSTEARFAYLSLAVALVAAGTALRRRDVGAAVRVACLVLLAAAALIMLSRTLIGSSAQTARVNLVPGETLLRLDRRDGADTVKNVVGNVVLFGPLGFFSQLAFGWRVRTVAVAACLVSTAVETAQLALGDRWVDIDDVILNTTGAVLGASAAVLGSRLMQRTARRV
jgi:glycopeptide antibiotics resistance protein